MLQFAIWIGFYAAYQVARGAADRGGSRDRFANGQSVIDFQRSLGSMIELPLQHARRELVVPDPGDLVHVLALAVRGRRDRAALDLLPRPRALLPASGTR